jgi:hypothetical protein
MSFDHAPYRPMHLRTEDFVEIDSITRADGRVLKRFHLKGYPDLIFTESPMDQTFEVVEIERKPMEMPTGGIFYLKYEYGASSKDED